jgi:Spy/CpxP family protein refolding chaperone
MSFPLLLGALILGAPSVQAQAAAPSEGKAAAGGKDAATNDYRCPMGSGYGMGPGMTGGYGMGPGMMGGYGMGPGMMGGYGMGPGMMGGTGMGPRGLPDLTADQRTKIAKIRDETRKKNWELMGQLMDEQTRLGDLYEAPKQDSDAIGASYKKITELQRKMYESAADAHKRMEAVLTPEQKEKWWRSWRR